jgi:hypothetical protein
MMHVRVLGFRIGTCDSEDRHGDLRIYWTVDLEPQGKRFIRVDGKRKANYTQLTVDLDSGIVTTTDDLAGHVQRSADWSVFNLSRAS